jgi:hypothetical protein
VEKGAGWECWEGAQLIQQPLSACSAGGSFITSSGQHAINITTVALHHHTNFFEKNHYLEADSLSTVQEISHLLWNRKGHCRVHKSPPLEPIMTQTNPFDTLTPYFSKTYFNTCNKNLLFFISRFGQEKVPTRYWVRSIILI